MHSNFDEIDLDGIRRGDRSALKRVWDHHADFVFYLAAKIMASRESAEDVVQEVFVKLATSGSSIRDIKALRGWLAVATRNTCIDHIRRSGKHVVTPPQDMTEIPAAEVFDAVREAELEMVGKLMDEVAREPGGETLIQFYREGLPAAEIARRKGEAVSTVTSRLARLRGKLRARILAAELENAEGPHDR
jgi:RNA polymerase sigma factor (sigma-70 family)